MSLTAAKMKDSLKDQLLAEEQELKKESEAVEDELHAVKKAKVRVSKKENEKEKVETD